MDILGTFLVVQWLRLCAFNAEGTGLIPSQGTRFHIQHGLAKNKKIKMDILNFVA